LKKKEEVTPRTSDTWPVEPPYISFVDPFMIYRSYPDYIFQRYFSGLSRDKGGVL